MTYNNLPLSFTNLSPNPCQRMPAKSASGSSRQAPKCPICLEDFVDQCRIRRLRCIHNFHTECIDKWLMKNMICPVCRKPIDR